MPTAAEKFVKDNGAKLYDHVKVTTPSKEYEGIIMPKHRLSGEQIIVLKLLYLVYVYYRPMLLEEHNTTAGPPYKKNQCDDYDSFHKKKYPTR